MNEREIIRALKSERCPPSVLKRVQAAVRSEKSSVAVWTWGIPVGIAAAMAILLLLIPADINDDAVVAGKMGAQNNTAARRDETVPAAPVAEDYAAEAEELKFIFTYIGLTLAEETDRNRDLILRRTVPVVKDSIESTERYINNKIRGKKLL